MSDLSVKINLSTIRQHKMLVCVVLLCIINAMVTKSTSLSLIISLLEVAYVGCMLLTNKVGDFILAFLLMAGASIESAALALGDARQTFYSFLFLPGISSYHIYFMLLIADFLCLKKARGFLKENSNLTKISKTFFFILVIQIIMFLFTFFFNDNGVLNINGALRYAVKDMQYMFVTISIVYILGVCLLYNQFFANKLHIFLEDFLIGVVIAAFVLVLTGNYYLRQSGTTMQLTCTLALMVTSSMILLFYTEKNGVVFLAFGLLSILIQKDYTLGIAGSWWLIVGTTIALFVICSIPSELTKKKIIRSFLIILLVVMVGVISLQNDLFGSILSYQITYKLESFKRIFDFNTNMSVWFAALGNSIQARIEEVVNVFLEFIQKPWFLLLGKGFGGTVIKYWGISNWNVYGSTYPDIQITTGVYSSMHTGIAEIFLNSGIVGLLFYLKIAWLGIKDVLNKNRNAWCFMGIWGILMMYNFISVCITVAFLCYGIYLIDERNRQ